MAESQEDVSAAEQRGEESALIECMRRYRQKHRDRINRTRRLRRLGLAQPSTGGLIVRLTQIDGTLPNLALMKLAAFHRQRGDTVVLSRSPYRSPAEPHYDRVYGSAIFSFSARRVERLRAEFPDAMVGGTWDPANRITVEDVIGDFDGLDYSLWPDFIFGPAWPILSCPVYRR